MSKQYFGKKPQHHSQPINTPFADKLQGYHGRNTGSKRLSDLEGDGIDHINVYQFPQTELGHLLSPFSEAPFTIPLHGRFNSREGLYYFLLSTIGDDAYRTMKPKAMRHYSKVNGNMGQQYPNMAYFMAKALCAQMNDNPRIAELLMENDLPFEAYFVITSRVDNIISHILTRPFDARWMLNIVNDISKAIQMDVDFNLDNFIGNIDELERLEKKVSRPFIAPPAPKKKQPQQQPQQRKIPNLSVVAHSNEELAKYQEAAKTRIVENAKTVLELVDPEHKVESLPVLNSLEALDAMLDGNAVEVELQHQQRGETTVFQHVDESGVLNEQTPEVDNKTEVSSQEEPLVDAAPSSSEPLEFKDAVAIDDPMSGVDSSVQEEPMGEVSEPKEVKDIVITNIGKDVLIPKYNTDV